MEIEEVIDNFVKYVGGEDAYIDVMAEIADECQRKIGINDIRNFYKNAGNDGCIVKDADNLPNAPLLSRERHNSW